MQLQAPAVAPPTISKAASEATAASRKGCLKGSRVQLSAVFSDALQGAEIRLHQQLSFGGFAVVHVGRVVRNSSNSSSKEASQVAKVAVKVYKPALQTNFTAPVLEDFAARELAVLKLLRGNMNAVQLLATGHIATGDGSSSSSSGLKCVVLEYMPGGSVADALKKLVWHTSCPEAQCKAYAKQVLQLLDLMHSSQLGCTILHRDIKPANLLLGEQGRIALADFGGCVINHPGGWKELGGAAAGSNSGNSGNNGDSNRSSSSLDACVSSTTLLAAVTDAAAMPHAPVNMQLQTMICTPFYTPSDVFNAVNTASSTSQQVVKLDTSTDMFSFGVTIMEMLTGTLSTRTEEPKSMAAVKEWEEVVRSFVDQDASGLTRGGVSEEAREFVGCCCGLG